jgi:alpha-glucuronidase
MKSGRTLWDELCHSYYTGADSVKWMQQTWNTIKSKIDPERAHHVTQFLSIQQKEAVWWRNACVLYFQSFSNLPIPAGLERPDKPLPYYIQLEFPHAPGIRPQW